MFLGSTYLLKVIHNYVATTLYEYILIPSYDWHVPAYMYTKGYIYMWVSLKQYSNVCLRRVYIDTVVVKELNFVNECDHALWRLNLVIIWHMARDNN